jgi:hypothetical protein
VILALFIDPLNEKTHRRWMMSVCPRVNHEQVIYTLFNYIPTLKERKVVHTMCRAHMTYEQIILFITIYILTLESRNDVRRTYQILYCCWANHHSCWACYGRDTIFSVYNWLDVCSEYDCWLIQILVSWMFVSQCCGDWITCYVPES